MSGEDQDIKSKVSFSQLTNISYGSTDGRSTDDELSLPGSPTNSDDGSSPRSFHLGNKGVSKQNIWTSFRRTKSFIEHGTEYDLVPTQLLDNVKLVTDPNLDDNENGMLYYAAEAFYDHEVDPQYALTVHPDIYQKILREVDDATQTPCGLYFCCHGGDGAHTGVSHDDYVDIRLAWALVGTSFAIMLLLSWTVP